VDKSIELLDHLDDWIFFTHRVDLDLSDLHTLVDLLDVGHLVQLLLHRVRKHFLLEVECLLLYLSFVLSPVFGHLESMLEFLHGVFVVLADKFSVSNFVIDALLSTVCVVL